MACVCCAEFRGVRQKDTRMPGTAFPGNLRPGKGKVPETTLRARRETLRAEGREDLAPSRRRPRIGWMHREPAEANAIRALARRKPSAGSPCRVGRPERTGLRRRTGRPQDSSRATGMAVPRPAMPGPARRPAPTRPCAPEGKPTIRAGCCCPC